MNYIYIYLYISNKNKSLNYAILLLLKDFLGHLRMITLFFFCFSLLIKSNLMMF